VNHLNDIASADIRKDIFGLALPDTFGSHLFLSSFANSYGPSSMGLAHGYNGMAFCDIFTGLRHDSGEPLEWLNWIEKYYENTRRDVETAAARSSLSTRKTLMFSESLTIQKCIELKGQVQARGFDVVFSMTSHLTSMYCLSLCDYLFPTY
jgi:nicotinate phosphoribosyltransferase